MVPIANRTLAEPAKRSRVTAHSPAGEAVLGYLRDQVTAISRYDPLVRRDEPDAVHQMRGPVCRRGCSVRARRHGRRQPAEIESGLSGLWMTYGCGCRA